MSTFRPRPTSNKLSPTAIGAIALLALTLAGCASAATPTPEIPNVVPDLPSAAPEETSADTEAEVPSGMPSADALCSALQSLPNLDAVAGGTVTEFDPKVTHGNMFGGDSTGCTGYYGAQGTGQFVDLAYLVGDDAKIAQQYDALSSGEDMPIGTKASCQTYGCFMVLPGAMLYFAADNSTLNEEEWTTALTAVASQLELI